MKEISLDSQELAKQIKITVGIQRYNQFRFRLWLAEKLVKLGMALSWVDYEIVENHPLEQKIEQLGEAGIVISIAYGPTPNGLHWSVDCLDDKTKETFNKPFGANSLAHCIEIAYIEAEKRGWIDDTTTPL